MNTQHQRLLSLAYRYVEALQRRLNVTGLALYGSLACCDPADVNEFSDIDYALVLEGELPPYFVEHRLVEGIRLDVLYFSRALITDLTVNRPFSLWERGWTARYLIESLALGSAETVLFDPHGELAAVKNSLKRATSYGELLLPDASDWFHRTVAEPLAQAKAHLEEGDTREAVRAAGEAAARFSGLVRMFAGRKVRAAAAERLGIPRFDVVAREVEEIRTPRNVEAIWEAARSLCEHALRTAYEPIMGELAAAGVPEPEKVELVGDTRVFWGGPRIHELGRVIADVSLSLDWSRSELDHGDPAAALSVLWPVRTVESTMERWRRLDTALQGAGYDVSPIVARFLENPETRRLGAELDRENERASLPTPSRAEAEAAVRMADELRELLAGAFPLMSPAAVAELRARGAGRSGDA